MRRASAPTPRDQADSRTPPQAACQSAKMAESLHVYWSSAAAGAGGGRSSVYRVRQGVSGSDRSPRVALRQCARHSAATTARRRVRVYGLACRGPCRDPCRRRLKAGSVVAGIGRDGERSGQVLVEQFDFHLVEEATLVAGQRNAADDRDMAAAGPFHDLPRIGPQHLVVEPAAQEQEPAAGAALLHLVGNRRLDVDFRQHLDIVGIRDQEVARPARPRHAACRAACARLGGRRPATFRAGGVIGAIPACSPGFAREEPWISPQSRLPGCRPRAWRRRTRCRRSAAGAAASARCSGVGAHRRREGRRHQLVQRGAVAVGFRCTARPPSNCRARAAAARPWCAQPGRQILMRGRHRRARPARRRPGRDRASASRPAAAPHRAGDRRGEIEHRVSPRRRACARSR